ncbi:MAG: hypothetical protein ABIK31_07285, partial [candidate division WOR-3 bacterium]
MDRIDSDKDQKKNKIKSASTGQDNLSNQSEADKGPSEPIKKRRGRPPKPKTTKSPTITKTTRKSKSKHIETTNSQPTEAVS